ncbi:hypothetical protein M3Y99_01261900 [Aphelenchoides fujianensis]|nr:hypothetical protein M3Y99_01259900 [Aphelenchoides fujianensis]KAI6227394.1 hypothetical protein M3Y99_01261900 [Aphelenchoides fujianensis]
MSALVLLVLVGCLRPLSATQSVFSCPLTAGGFGGGEICGSGSFLHYWTCCPDFPFECCWYFELWATVLFSVLLLLLLAVGLFALGRHITRRRREDDEL